MTEIDHNKRLADGLSHPKCPRCNSNDKNECKQGWYEWTESWRPSMAKEDKPSPK